MPKIVTVAQMRQIEQEANAGGLSFAQMMENAGNSIAQAIQDQIGELEGMRVVVLAGSGNNGGDGLVAGDLLAEAGAQVSVYLTKARADDDPHLARLKERGLLPAVADQDQRQRVLKLQLENADIVIDAVLGTGISLPLHGSAAKVLATAKQVLSARSHAAYIVAVDCPSGLDCDSGDIAQETLEADLTVTLAAVKPGLLTFPGSALVGELLVGDIGLPRNHPSLAEIQTEFTTQDTVRSWLPDRPLDSHKGTFGTVLVVAGSRAYPGAAALAGKAAYRAGAGLVRMAIPESIQGIIAPGWLEAVWTLLPDQNGALTQAAAQFIRDAMDGVQACLLGPGFGLAEETGKMLQTLLDELEDEVPAWVVDADGLKMLASIPDWSRKLPALTVLTPHPGEMSILSGETKEVLQADRIAAARRWASRWRHVVLFKGAHSVIAAPDGRVQVLPFASSALATAGTGDVLAGLVAGFIAQGLEAFEAAVLGAYVHGLAGAYASWRLGSDAAVVAGDVLERIPNALAEMLGNSV